jgi:hypothetical protein
MQKYLAGVILLVSLGLSQTAAADSRDHHRSYRGSSFGSHYRGFDRYSSRYYSSYRANPYHYGVSRRGGFDFSYNNRYYRHRDNEAGIFVGGLVLGSLLTRPYYSRPPERVIYRSVPVVQRPEVIVVRDADRVTPSSTGRRLLRDLDGNCFEIERDEAGNEIRVQLDASECRF